MTSASILSPVFALASWTGCVLLLIPLARFRAAWRRQIGVDDFKYGESPAVPPEVSIPNRNYMNLLELPVLFYVVCMIISITGGASPAMLNVAWLFVALRVVHSLIHLSYNRVMHRFAAFLASNTALLVLWVLTGARVFAG